MPAPSTNRLRLTPFLARSVGFSPVFFPPEGCLGHAPVHTQPVPIDALEVVVLEQSCLPQGQEHARHYPFLEAVVRRGAWAELGGIECFPLTTGAEYEEDGVQANTVWGARPATAEPMPIHMDRQVTLDVSPQFIGDTPISGNTTVIHNGT